MATLTSKAVGSAKWMGAGQLLRAGMSTLTIAILARYLDSALFGAIGLVIVFTQFAQIIVTGGLGAAAIQKPNLTEGDKSLIFWLNILVGGTISLSAFFAAKPIAVLMGEPTAAYAFQLNSPIFLLTGITVIHRAMLEREMNYRTISLIETVSAIVACIAAIVMAMMGWGIEALVAQFMVQAIVTTLWFMVATHWWPHFYFRTKQARSILSFSGSLTLHQMIYFFGSNADRPLISHWLGVSALGYYNLASQIVVYPTRSIASLMQRIMFPLLASVQDDHGSFRRAYLDTMHAVILVLAPMMAGAAAVSHDLTVVGFGERWLPMAPLIALFSVRSLLRATGGLASVILLAKGRSDLQLPIGIATSVFSIAGYVVGLYFGGLNGAAIGGLATSLFANILLDHYAFPLIDLTHKAAWSVLWKPLFSSALMAVAVYGLFLLMPALSPIFRLCLLVTAGAIVYGVSEYLIDRPRLANVIRKTTGRSFFK